MLNMSKEQGEGKKPLKRVFIPMNDEMIQMIEDYRYTQHLPSQAVAVRQMIERAYMDWKDELK